MIANSNMPGSTSWKKKMTAKVMGNNHNRNLTNQIKTKRKAKNQYSYNGANKYKGGPGGTNSQSIFHEKGIIGQVDVLLLCTGEIMGFQIGEIVGFLVKQQFIVVFLLDKVGFIESEPEKTVGRGSESAFCG